MSVTRVAQLVGVGSLWGLALSIAPLVGSIVIGTPVSYDTPGLAERYAEAPLVIDGEAALGEAAEVAALTVGMECWDPSTGRVGTHLVVRDAVTGVVSVVPFDAETYAAAQAGEFWTLKGCA